MENRMNKKGLNLVELVIVMAIVALILSIVIPNFRSMQQDGSLTKVEGDLDTLKGAIVSYWKNNSQAYPENIHTALTSSTPSLLTKVLADPWATDGSNSTYGYGVGKDATFGEYFFVYTKGPNSDTTPEWDAANQRVKYSGTGRVVSNAPVVRN